MSNSFEDIQRVRDTQVKSVVLTYQSLAKSLQLIAAETNAYSNNAVDTWTSFLERLLGAKSLDLVIQLQTEYTREAFADFVSANEENTRTLLQSRQGNVQIGRNSNSRFLRRGSRGKLSAREPPG